MIAAFVWLSVLSVLAALYVPLNELLHAAKRERLDKVESQLVDLRVELAELRGRVGR